MTLTRLGGYLIAFAFLYLVKLAFDIVKSTLRSVPGPFLARFTRLWYVLRVYKGNFKRENIKLHEMLGPTVRGGPNEFSVADPGAIKTIYGYGTEFNKSRWYEAGGSARDIHTFHPSRQQDPWARTSQVSGDVFDEQPRDVWRIHEGMY